ncbi:hypothetical protein K440DRAFT_614478 [Wilcoxina mikolae CBS 423.85]|nr:hypothetical protein K440DRAFT_614478 [Wilcoxina mikolae CBS 423.85]
MYQKLPLGMVAIAAERHPGFFPTPFHDIPTDSVIPDSVLPSTNILHQPFATLSTLTRLEPSIPPLSAYQRHHPNPRPHTSIISTPHPSTSDIGAETQGWKILMGIEKFSRGIGAILPAPGRTAISSDKQWVGRCHISPAPDSGLWFVPAFRRCGSWLGKSYR